MELRIESSKDIVDFCMYLIKQMREYLPKTIVSDKLDRFNLYINDPKNKIITIKLLDCSDILKAGTYNLICTQNGDYYTIRLDSKIFIPDSNAKFINIISLINYGNLMLKPYPIWSDMMQHFADNIEMYYRNYLEENSDVS